jgi:hypothetical protein
MTSLRRSYEPTVIDDSGGDGFNAAGHGHDGGSGDQGDDFAQHAVCRGQNLPCERGIRQI